MPDRLLKIVPAFWALKADHVRIDIWHRDLSSPTTRRARGRTAPEPTGSHIRTALSQDVCAVARFRATRSGQPRGIRQDGEDYRGFEAAIIADYDAETAVERETRVAPAARQSSPVQPSRYLTERAGKSSFLRRCRNR
jgi:hypothetical protein